MVCFVPGSRLDPLVEAAVHQHSPSSAPRPHPRPEDQTMLRSIRSVACSAALVGLSSLLGACDAVAPTAVAPEAAPAASLSARVGQVQQERLRKAGRSGLKRGVNYTPPGLTRSQSAPAFGVQNLRMG